MIPMICFLLTFSFKKVIDINIDTTRLNFSIGNTTLASPSAKALK